MYKTYRFLLFWSEVWAVIIPLAIYYITYSRQQELKKIARYLLIVLLLNTVAVLLSIRHLLPIPDEFKNNGIIYNLLAILKVYMLGGYLIKQPQLQKFGYLKYLFWGYSIFLILNFTIWGSIFQISSYLFAASSIAMLVICLTFFLNAILDDEAITGYDSPIFLICVGISIYEAVNFFIYLFLFELYMTNITFSRAAMDIFRYSFILSCLLFAFAFIKGRRKNILNTLTAVNEK